MTHDGSDAGLQPGLHRPGRSPAETRQLLISACLVLVQPQQLQSLQVASPLLAEAGSEGRATVVALPSLGALTSLALSGLHTELHDMRQLGTHGAAALPFSACPVSPWTARGANPAFHTAAPAV